MAPFLVVVRLPAAFARDDSNELGELKRVVSSLLQNVDTMSSDSLLLAATNHEHLLDSAVWRRFDYRVEIELPDAEAISRMIDLFSHDISTIDPKDRYLMAVAFSGLSGADIDSQDSDEPESSTIYTEVVQGFKELGYVVNDLAMRQQIRQRQ